MEETIRVPTITELLRPTRRVLCELAARITAALPYYPEGLPELADVPTNLRNIRWGLALRDFSL
jgi:hypothetical protein